MVLEAHYLLATVVQLPEAVVLEANPIHGIAACCHCQCCLLPLPMLVELLHVATASTLALLLLVEPVPADSASSDHYSPARDSLGYSRQASQTSFHSVSEATKPPNLRTRTPRTLFSSRLGPSWNLAVQGLTH